MVLYATIIPYNYSSLDTENLDPAEVIIKFFKDLSVKFNLFMRLSINIFIKKFLNFDFYLVLNSRKISKC